MDNVWFASALWIGLALIAASLQAWVAVSVALLEIIIGAVPGNLVSLNTFRRETARSWLHALRRRSQRHRLSWERFGPIVDHWFPRVQVLHEHPNDRFYAKHPK